MQRFSYRELSARIRCGLPGERTPLHGMIEVTRRCPLRCAHCYNNLPLTDREAAGRELDAAEHCRLIEEIAAAGCLWLTFTGGEIFARPDFLEIYAHAVSRGLLVSLFTNGHLITPEIADRLRARRPYAIEIPLYGVSSETHERVTGVAGSHQRCLRAIRLLKERGLPLRLKTMALTANQHEVLALKRFAEEELGLSFRFDAMVTPRLDFSQAPLRLRLPPSRVVELDQQDPRVKSGWERFAAGCGDSRRSAGERYYCNAGITAFGIDPYGGLSLCLFSPAGKHDLRTRSFQEGWDGPLLRERRRKTTTSSSCDRCSLRPLCGMCPPNGELERGDPEGPVPYFCEVAHLRAQALGRPAAPHGSCAYCTPTGSGVSRGARGRRAYDPE